MPAWKPERGSSTPTFNAAPCARTMAGAGSVAVTEAVPASRRRRGSVVFMESSLELCANLEALSRPGQANIVMHYNILRDGRLRGKQPLDAGRNLEQAAVMPVARHQHQADRQPAAGDRDRNRAHVEEIPRRRIAQQQHVLAVERMRVLPRSEEHTA